MKLELHDANTDDPVVGKMNGPTHAATVTVDYEYQAEMWLDDIAADHPHISSMCSDKNRSEWEDYK